MPWLREWQGDLSAGTLSHYRRGTIEGVLGCLRGRYGETSARARMAKTDLYFVSNFHETLEEVVKPDYKLCPHVL